jgi:hypothetical protein
VEVKIQDILLIQNLLQAQASLKNSENWVPLCLPGISPDGYIFAFIHYIFQDMALIIISDGNTHDMFEQC